MAKVFVSSQNYFPQSALYSQCGSFDALPTHNRSHAVVVPPLERFYHKCYRWLKRLKPSTEARRVLMWRRLRFPKSEPR